MGEIAFIAALAAAAWFWYDSMRAREAAVALGKKICGSEGVQFLDDTVALAVLRVARNGKGHAAIRRTYRFEFSAVGTDRLSGSIVMLGNQMELFNLDPHQKGEAYAAPTGAVSCCGGGCHGGGEAHCD